MYIVLLMECVISNALGLAIISLLNIDRYRLNILPLSKTSYLFISHFSKCEIFSTPHLFHLSSKIRISYVLHKVQGIIQSKYLS